MRTGRLPTYLRFLAANVRALRKQRDLTQEELAEMARIEPRFLGSIERAAANPSLDVLIALCEALRVEPGRIFKRARFERAGRGRPRTRSAPKARR